MNIIKRYIAFRTVSTSGGGGGTWGSITGTLSDQTDLQSELDQKAPAFLIYETVDMSVATNYTAVAADNNKVKILPKTSPQTFTLPQLPAGTQFIVRRTSSGGQITFVPDIGQGVSAIATKGADFTDPGLNLPTFISYKNPIEVYIDNGVTSSGGSGDVVGPASAVNNNFAAFDLTTGKLIKDSGSNASSFDAAGAASTAQAFSIQRANHTGTQTASTISDFNTAALAAAPAENTTTIGALINGATDKPTPVDADYIGIMDSAASNILKKLSWANIKATLKTYFDTLYSPISAASPTRILISTTSTNANVTPLTLADATDYVIPVVAGRYFVKVWVPFSSGAITNGIRLVAAGGTITAIKGIVTSQLTATTRSGQQITAINTPTAANASSLSANNVAIMEFDVTSSGSGSIQIRFANEEASTAIDIVAGGIIEYTKIA